MHPSSMKGYVAKKRLKAPGLTQWLNGKQKSMPLEELMIRRDPTNHFSDCHLCLTKIYMQNSKICKTRQVKYCLPTMTFHATPSHSF